jgi:hypothetical protein
MSLIRVYDFLARWWIAAVFGNLTVIFFIIFGVIGPDLPDGAPGVVDLQLAFNKTEFSRIIDVWGLDAVDRYKDTMWLDYVFPPVYAIFFTSALAALTFDAERYPGRIVRGLFVLPFAAALCDLLENTLHLIILRDPATLPAALIFLASVVAAIKWALLGIAAVVVVALLIWRGIAIRAQR